MTLPKFKQKELRITLNYYRILLFAAVYFFGFYGIGTIEPIWNNLDGLIFFWVYQLSVLISLVVVFAILPKISNAELAKKNFAITIQLKDIFTFVLFFCFLLVLNYQSITNDLAEDETSYAGYTVHHLDKILYDLNLSILSDANVSTIYRIGLFIFLLVGILFIKLFSFVNWQNTIILSFVLLISLRLMNQTYFKLNVYSLPYTDPLFLIHQIGTILFGFTSLGFRLSTIAFFAIFMLCVKIVLEKYYFFSNMKSITTTIIINSLPIVLSMTTRIDHGQFTYFSQVFVWLYILSPHRIPSKFIAPFLVVSIYFSLTSINILITFLLFYLSNNVGRNQLRNHIKFEWKLYMFLTPIIIITTLKTIKDWHLRSFITGYSFIPYEERIWTLIKTVPSAVGGIYVFFIIFFIFYLSYRKVLNSFLLSIYLLVTLFIYTFFVVTTALNHNRYSFQLISSLVVVLVLHFMKSNSSFKSIQTPAALIFLLSNLIVFTLFQRNYNNFDRYVKQNEWNYAVNYVRQPFNVIWPSTAYNRALKLQQNIREGGHICVLLGLYYKSVPYALSGNDLRYMRTVEKITSLPAHRLYLNDFNNYRPGDNWTFHKEVNCIIISNMYFKREFIDFLLTQNWIINYSYESNNGIQVFTLQRANI